MHLLPGDETPVQVPRSWGDSGPKTQTEGGRDIGQKVIIKKQKVDVSEVEIVEPTGASGVTKESWDELVMAIQTIGAGLSDLTQVVSDLGTDISEMTKTNKSTSDTTKELLVKFQDLTWIQNQTKGLLHVVARRLESLDGVERVPEQNPEVMGMEVEKKSEKADVKGKGKELIPDSEEAKDGESDESEEEEEGGDDVVKGPEILTLDVDELMEVEN